MVQIVRVLSFALLCGLLSDSALADDLSRAKQALQVGKHQEALPLLQSLVAQDDPDAMIDLGRMYQDGLGAQRSQDMAVGWYGKAIKIWTKRAKDGDPRAYASLGVLFNKGIGFKKDLARARKYFRIAFDMAQPKALAGDIDAQNLVGMLYSSGKGVNKDIFTGADWLSKAGEGGHQASARMLVHIFECGCRGLPRDEAKAEYWRTKLVMTR